MEKFKHITEVEKSESVEGLTIYEGEYNIIHSLIEYKETDIAYQKSVLKETVKNTKSYISECESNLKDLRDKLTVVQNKIIDERISKLNKESLA